MKHVFAFDPDKCCACSSCVIACMDQNDINVKEGDAAFRKAFDTELKTEDGLYFAYLSAACMHCADAPCIGSCPVGCIKKDPETGFTVYDNANCIGCRSCAMACPFGAPRYRASDGKMVKCDGCYMRVKNGMEPACVRACTFGALTCVTEQEFRENGNLKALHQLAKTLSPKK